MEEVWKDIYFEDKGVIWDYRELYQVSNLGNIKSLNYKRTGKEKILKKHKKSDGYFDVILCKNGKMKHFNIHRLVAHMFIDGYFDGAEVDHINTIRDDNRVENLKWCTASDNMNNSTTKERFKNNKNGKGNKGKPKKNSILLERYDMDGNLIDIKYQYEYMEMGFDCGNISNCCKGKRKSHKGFIFKYHIED